MDLRAISDSQRKEYNQVVTHVIQSWEWGEFRKSLGLPLLRYGIFRNGKLYKAFQLTLHKIPYTRLFVGYLPKGPLPDKELHQALTQIGKENNCAFIKLEPDVLGGGKPFSVYPSFLPSPKPLFTKYNFVLDLTPSEEELLKKMHSKTRYNIRLAEKKGVIVEERIDEKGLEIYLDLYFETTRRQNYHGHNRQYHTKVFETFKQTGQVRFLIASYNKTPLTAWMLLDFNDKLYYPYGGSSLKHRDVMASNLIAWEAIKLGKKLDLKTFDMWGALGPDPNPKDPWFGFHKFKMGYGGDLVEYLGTYDLVFKASIYQAFTMIDRFTKLKVLLLKILGK